MRILWLSQYYPFPPHDGNALPIYEFLRRLAPKTQITLLTHEPAEPERIELGKRACVEWNVGLECVKRPVLLNGQQFLAYLQSDIWWPNRFFSRPFALRAAELLQQHPYDLILSEGILSAQHLSRALEIPHVLMARDCLSLAHRRRWRLTRDAREWLQSHKIACMERALFRRSALVLAISTVDQAAMQQISPASRIEVLPNGVDLEMFRPEPEREEADTVVFSGDLGTPANADAALWLAREIWPMVRAACPKARLVLAGRNPSLELSALAASDIEITGAVTDMPAVLARAAVIVSPLRLGTGIKNKLLEGAAMGKAMVVTPLSLEGLSFQPVRDLLVATIAADFASKITELLQNAILRQQLGNAARLCVEKHYNWKEMSERLYDFLQQITVK